MANESAFDNAATSGRTGVITNTTAYGVLTAGTTATGAIQNAGAGNAGQVLTSNGAAALPSFGASPGSNAKVWINFDGTGVIATNVSFNVTSITDNDTGDYTVTIATNFSSANYCTQLSGARGSVGASDTGLESYTTTDLAAGAVRVFTGNGVGAHLDYELVDVTCWGTQ